ncbi:MAG: GHKL domain-containing protein [Clostridia bacterium]|nr:GHKL domain-containing protein [Clostridia bacterium]
MEIEYDLEPDIEINIPPLILQPIVENAVRHGIYPKKEGGKVEISVRREGKAVQIKIRDNGVGMTEEKIKEVLNDQRHVGIGIQNVHKRLISYYGYGLSIRSQVAKGTEVIIKIPCSANKGNASRAV